MPDAASQLAPLTTITADVTLTPLLCHPTRWPTTGWVVHVQSAAVTGGIVFLLEVASTLAGPWQEVSRIAWPPGETRTAQLIAGVNGSLARTINPTALYARLRVTTTPPQPGVVFGSWLTTEGGPFGLASRSYALDNVGPL
jgi:hypothetical protein